MKGKIDFYSDFRLIYFLILSLIISTVFGFGMFSFYAIINNGAYALLDVFVGLVCSAAMMVIIKPMWDK